MRLLINLAVFGVMFSLCWLATDNVWLGVIIAAAGAAVSEVIQRLAVRRK